jgi:hypothetical protein
MSSKRTPGLLHAASRTTSIWPSPAPSRPKAQPAGKTPGARCQATPTASRLASCGGRSQRSGTPALAGARAWREAQLGSGRRFPVSGQSRRQSASGTALAVPRRALPFLAKWRPIVIEPAMPSAVAAKGSVWS